MALFPKNVVPLAAKLQQFILITTEFGKKKPENVTARKCIPKIKQSKKMKRYFKNLWHALIGRNPFQLELERVREDFKKTEAKVRDLNALYYEVRSKIQNSEHQINDYQVLVENLRRRLADKDDIIKALQSSMLNKEEKQ